MDSDNWTGLFFGLFLVAFATGIAIGISIGESINKDTIHKLCLEKVSAGSPKQVEEDMKKCEFSK